MHKPVLLQETIEALDLKAGDTFLDGTFGGGGHSREVLRRFGDKVRIVGLDQDPAVAKAMAGKPEFEIHTLNFSEIGSLDIEPDTILLDIGISSDQIDASGRGFSFLRDEPLDMRMSQSGPTAADILNSFDEHAIELILRGFGEERYSRRITKAIVARRELRPFQTTQELVQVVEEAIPSFAKATQGKHPATRTFQALRIAVNSELEVLERGLKEGFEKLKPGGRFAVITFHSLEDRIVKNFFRDRATEGRGELINKKPITPTEEEIRENPRARSAKLRIIKKHV